MLKYILEIKNRLFLLLTTWISTVYVSYFYKEILLFIITQINENYCSTSSYFIFTNLIEIFNVYITLIFFLTNQSFVLYLLYHLFFFVSPALFKFEYKYFHFIVRRVLFVWFCSIIFFNYVFIPLTWLFFLSFQNSTIINLYFEAKLNEFILFYISVYYLCISYCLVFMVLFFILNYININTKFVRKFRKLYYYLFIFFSTIISPPDIFSQLLVSLFIILVYEFLVITSMLKF